MHSDYLKAESINVQQRNIQSIDEISGQGPQAMWPSLDAISNTRHASKLQCDFADIHSRNQQANTMQTNESNHPATSISSSHVTMHKPPSFRHEPSKPSLHNFPLPQNEMIGVLHGVPSKQQAGKIVHRFRSYQEG